MPRSLVLLTLVAAWLTPHAADAADRLNPVADLLSLHYDHAPDRDDGHSAAADYSVLLELYGEDWIAEHAVAVSGAYGLNGPQFVPESDAVMDAVFGPGAWLDAHEDHAAVVAALLDRWEATLRAGGDVWVKEGGQSDITAEVVRRFKTEAPEVDTTARVHVVQHSDWNERQTTPAALAYVRAETDYVRIRDANAYLNVAGGDGAFEATALGHPRLGPAWAAAFDYYPPRERLDFSDTGELLHLLGVGELGFDAFRERYLAPSNDAE